MKFATVAATSERIRKRGARLQKIDALRDLLREIPQEFIRPIVAMLAGVLPSGKLGVGHATVRAAQPSEFSTNASLTLQEVLDAFQEVADASGPGSKQRKLDLLQTLFRQSTNVEADFLFGLLTGELRQGALEGVMIDAVARETGIDLERVRRATMLAGDPALVAKTLLTQGESGLEQFQVCVFTPIQPMLAQPAESPAAAMEGMQRVAIDIKMDGVRVQIHRRDHEVRVYSRQLNDVTASVPELVEEALRWPCNEAIVDGETFVVGLSGAPLPFQVTMSRFGRKVAVTAARTKSPLELRVFDLLYMDARDYTGCPLAERWEALDNLLDPAVRIPARTVHNVAEAKTFLDEALAAGHEGAMIKDLGSEYRAGTRSSGWKKLKTSHTLDLVVLAAEWGSGRRSGKLSNLHLGARATDGQFVMLGKTFKGLTDKLLAWQTRELLARRLDPETADHPTEDSWVVRVRPELVVEIAFNNVQESSHYPGGMALRFARVKRYREDKTPETADTFETVQKIFHAERHDGVAGGHA